jgi:hypothetical protein
MTKVIAGRTDETCGCRNADPAIAERLAVNEFDRRRDEGILKRSNRYGPWCIK